MPQKQVEIYTWDNCPFCHRALDLLNSKGVEYIQHRIDGDELARAEMTQKTKGKKSSVPQIFIESMSIGGCDDLYALERKGELDRLLGV